MIRLSTDTLTGSPSSVRTSAVTMASSEQGNELPAVFNQMRCHPFFIRMVLKRKGFESADALSPTELRDWKID